MLRFVLFTLIVLLPASVAHAQLPSLTNPNPGCFMCVDSPAAGTFSERHYQRQQRTPSYAAPTLPSYDRGYSPGQNQYNHSLNNGRTPPPVTSGSADMYPTLELQLQADQNAILDSLRSQGCNSWTLEGC